MPRLHQTNASS